MLFYDFFDNNGVVPNSEKGMQNAKHQSISTPISASSMISIKRNSSQMLETSSKFENNDFSSTSSSSINQNGESNLGILNNNNINNSMAISNKFNSESIPKKLKPNNFELSSSTTTSSSSSSSSSSALSLSIASSTASMLTSIFSSPPPTFDELFPEVFSQLSSNEDTIELIPKVKQQSPSTSPSHINDNNNIINNIKQSTTVLPPKITLNSAPTLENFYETNSAATTSTTTTTSSTSKTTTTSSSTSSFSFTKNEKPNKGRRTNKKYEYDENDEDNEEYLESDNEIPREKRQRKIKKQKKRNQTKKQTKIKEEESESSWSSSPSSSSSMTPQHASTPEIVHEIFNDSRQIMSEIVGPKVYNIEKIYAAIKAAAKVSSWKDVKNILYPALRIESHGDHNSDAQTAKDHRIRNAINYRLGTLMQIFPHLQFYSEDKHHFRYTILRKCPDILINRENNELKQKYVEICRTEDDRKTFKQNK